MEFNSRIPVEVMVQEKNEKDNKYPNRFMVTNLANDQYTEISAKSVELRNEWAKAINIVSHNICTVIQYTYMHSL